MYSEVYILCIENTLKKKTQNETCILDAFGVLDWKEYEKMLEMTS